MLAAASIPAFADSLGPINFEPTAYTVGNINGQQGWMKTGGYDVAVADVSTFSNASGFGFGTQALRLSNAVASGSFGDQTFSPGLINAASENSGYKHFEASFKIGSTQAIQQSGLFLSVSPDDGLGSRMSYAGFQDETDGIHVIFYDVVDSGPLGTVANFNLSDVATIDRTHKHSIKFVIDFVPGPGNDVVKLYVDNVLRHTGTTWEDYYRYDPEQNGNGNQLFPISKLLFKEGGSSVPSNAGQGYLVDDVSLSSSIQNVSLPSDKDQCKNGGWSSFTDQYGNVFKNQGECVSWVNHNAGKYGIFTATDSLYYNCPSACENIYGSGPISFTWDKSTGNVINGYWDEVAPPNTGTTYQNVVSNGTVVSNTVNLTFDRTLPNSYHFTFIGNLIGNLLTGFADGPYYFTATGN